jgi:formate dehydrogenase subunit delta
MSAERIAQMANQIARAFAAEGREEAARDTADHIRKFWDPRMRAQLEALMIAGGDGLDPLALDAARLLFADSAEAS